MSSGATSAMLEVSRTGSLAPPAAVRRSSQSTSTCSTLSLGSLAVGNSTVVVRLKVVLPKLAGGAGASLPDTMSTYS